MNKDEICARIPHAGAMCLLDRVEAWDQDGITCSASSHHDARNPLRSHGRLHAVCGLEYAAQAMAVHGSLINDAGSGHSPENPPGKPKVGFLASVRELKMHVERLDKVAADLRIKVQRLNHIEGISVYGFEVAAGDRLLISGRAAVKIMLESTK